MDMIRKSIIWSLCFLLGFGLYAGSSNEVLCFGEKGQTKIEPAHIQHCCEADHQASAVIVDRGGYDHNCVDCADIPLDNSQWRRSSRCSEGSIIKAIALHQACIPAGEAGVNDGRSGSTLAAGCEKGSTSSILVAATVLRC